jgi:hypothetical protein
MSDLIPDVIRTTLNGSGNATVRFGPIRPGTAWRVTGVSVSVATATLEATGVLTRNGVRISETFSASSGASDNALPAEPLWPGQTYEFTWTGGDANAVATLSYRGTQLLGV